MDEKTAALIHLQRVTMEQNAASPVKNADITNALESWGIGSSAGGGSGSGGCGGGAWWCGVRGMGIMGVVCDGSAWVS